MGKTLHNYLRIEIIDPKDTTKGGLVLPDSAIPKPRWARVIEVGEGVPDITGQILRPDFQPGDLIYMYRHAPLKCDLSGLPGHENEGVTYFVSEGDVLLRFPGDKTPGEETFLEFVQPVGNWCIIELIDPPERRSAGGIIIPDTVKERPTFAKVLSAGVGLRTIAASLTSLIDSEIISSIKSRLPKAFADTVDEVLRNYSRHLKTHTPLTVKPGDVVIIYPGRDLELDLTDIGIFRKLRLIQEGDIMRIM